MTVLPDDHAAPLLLPRSDLPAEPRERAAFFISDSTGITAETLGSALLANFHGVQFTRQAIRFDDSVVAYQAASEEIAACVAAEGNPIDHPRDGLPAGIAGFSGRCFGLTSAPARLSQVGLQRWPHGEYASLGQCTRKLRPAEKLYRRHRIPFLSSSTKSVEEMPAVILRTTHRRVPSPLESST